MPKVKAHVSATHKETGERRWFSPGDNVPAAFRDSITNPAAWGKEEDADDTPPDVTDLPGGDDPASASGTVPTVETGDDGDDEEGEFEDNYEDEGVTNDDLRAELARRDLAVHGNKSDLVARLRADDAEHGEA